MSEVRCRVEGKELKLTNLEKVFWPAEGFTKANLIDYYRQVADWILPHLAGRPLVLRRFPDGIDGKTFYQQKCPGYAPDWLPTVRIASGQEQVIYCTVKDMPSLLWVANQGCIEMHPWLAKTPFLDYPDLLVLDLDPPRGTSFTDLIRVAQKVKEVLNEVGLKGYPKTSGSRGIHIYIPLEQCYQYWQVTKLAEVLARLTVQAMPAHTTVEHLIGKREGKIYIDYLQNGRGKTLASVYSLRPLPGAPVSIPLDWSELNDSLKPEVFSLSSVPKLLKDRGDLFEGVLRRPQRIDRLIKLLKL
ncbi:MAG: non-homologous end-joining DNA ligase [Bacillota bacterium]